MNEAPAPTPEVADLVHKFMKAMAEQRISMYAPYRWQQDFHAAGKDYPERMLMAANRCSAPWTIVETVPEPRPILELIYEQGFDVRSWDGESECVAQASGVFLKGIEPAFRVLLDNGQWFDCSAGHRVLTVAGWRDLDQLILSSSGLRWTQTVEDYQGNCGAVGCRDDGQLLPAEDSGLERLPLKGDAQTPARMVFSREDVAERISQHNIDYSKPVHFPIEDDPDRIAALCAMFQDPKPYIDALRKSEIHQALTRFDAGVALHRSDVSAPSRQFSSGPSLAGLSGLSAVAEKPAMPEGGRLVSLQSVSLYDHLEAMLQRPDDEAQVEIFYPLRHPALVGGTRIVAVIEIGYQPIMDFTVERTKCYRSGGAFHHNTGKTMSAAAEVTMHLTGRYDEISTEAKYPDTLPNGEKHPNSGELIWPNGWEGKRFDHPITLWTGSPTNETSRDIIQKELLGGLGDEIGTGWIPRRDMIGSPTIRQAGVRGVVDTFRVRHISGGVSTGLMKSYDQGWRKFQGTAPHVVWMDEEPIDYMIFSECQTRIITSHGTLLVTFTPLLGITELVEHFNTGGQGIYMRGATWDDAPHLDPADRERMKLSYRAHERDARTQGIPMLGEGAVFPVSDELISVDPFKLPEHWARIKGCDFGIDHPAAGAELAWDRDQDVIYVIDCYKKAQETSAYHAAWFNKTNRRIPVSWPHDGMNREKSGGRTIADGYRQHGVNMLPKSARYPKSGRDAEKGGGQPVEPIVDEVLERMQTGRFKVFTSCPAWFEEKRSYHREDGRIIARRDDIMKATFYALMMKRYAVAPSEFQTAAFSNMPQTPIASARI